MMKIDHHAIHTAARFLAEGKLVALPTETVYGLGGDARNPTAIQKIFEAKNRPAENPLIIHLSHVSAIQDYACDIPESAFILAKAFWPGPLTLVLPKHPSVLSIVTAGQNSVALRIPNHPVARALLDAFGGGIAAPSANRSGALSPTSAKHVREGMGSAVDYILDGGACEVGIESTIVSLMNDVPVILRQGHIRAEDIAQILGLKNLANPLEGNQFLAEKIIVPGSSLKHYAPSKPLRLLNHDALKEEIERCLLNHQKPAVLSFSFTRQQFLNDPSETQARMEQNKVLPWMTLIGNPTDYAHGLYAALHDLDQSDANIILVEMPPINTDWLAVHDRLQRASAL